MAIDNVPTIMEALFECTLEMINKNLEEYPEHRIHFFRLLQSITLHCFTGKIKRALWLLEKAQNSCNNTQYTVVIIIVYCSYNHSIL